MAAILFYALRFANKLKFAGVLPEHAEAEAEALAELFEVNLSVQVESHATGLGKLLSSRDGQSCA
jgi:hypothetical protein